MDDATWLEKAIALAVENVEAGGGPFAAVVVKDGEVLATGVNRVTSTHDPTAHAEVVAIRGACAALGDFRLTGTTLYSSCEPCPMCRTAALWARLDRVVYAADRDDAARAGFDDRRFLDLFEHPPARWPMPLTPVDVPDAQRPFEAWRSKPGRVPY